MSFQSVWIAFAREERRSSPLLKRPIIGIGRGDQIARRYPGEPAAAGVAGLLERGLHAPWTTSAGRWFDAAAGLLGVARHASYERQAAMRLEALAAHHGPVEPLAGGWRISGCDVLDAMPLLTRLADESDAARGAAMLHATLAEGLAAAAIEAARAGGLHGVVLGGGCWLNRLLAAAVESRLRAAGFEVWQASELPPGDGGLSLGQAWVAMNSGG